MTAAAANDLLTYGRLPPQSLEFEAAVLGAVLLEARALEVVGDILRPDSFYDPKHSAIWRAILSLEDSGRAVDLLTVTEELRRVGELDRIGGAYYLTLLTMNMVSSGHVESHARVVQDRHLLRETIRISMAAVADSYSPAADAKEILDTLGAGITSLSTGHIAQPFSGAPELARMALDELDHIIKHKDSVTGVPTGWRRLNELTNGWQPGDLIIVAARPSVGKTAFAQALALNAATDPGKPTGVGFFSLEMSKGSIMKRFLASLGKVDLQDLNAGRLDQSEIDRYIDAAHRFARLNIQIDDQPALNIYDLRAKARRMVSKHGVGLIVIDYLQLMTVLESYRIGNREQEISKISRDLKALAKELKVPLIVLSQLNRAVESRGDKTPQLSDLRESGAIEQDADCVMFLTRPSYMKAEDGGDPALEDAADIHIRKNRQGPLDDIPMYFVKKYQRWYDRAGYEDEYRFSFPPVGFKAITPGITGFQERQVRDYSEPAAAQLPEDDAPF